MENDNKGIGKFGSIFRKRSHHFCKINNNRDACGLRLLIHLSEEKNDVRESQFVATLVWNTS